MTSTDQTFRFLIIAMRIPTTNLWSYFISRIINGGRQLSGWHGEINKNDILEMLIEYIKAGVITFDCADIYTGVEALYGEMLKKAYNELWAEVYQTLRIHTKCVPDLQDIRDRKVNKQYIESIIDRSLMRLWQEQLHLVQLHHREYEVETYIEIAHYMKELQKAGKIHQLGVTNYNTGVLQQIIESGVSIVSTQNQYSLLDHRPEKHMRKLCEEQNIQMLCYGTLAGWLLSEKYLWANEPQEPYENRSLRKYKLIIDDFGWRNMYQDLLAILKYIADKYRVSISDIAMKYILEKPYVAWIIVGSRNSEHVHKISQPFSFSLDDQDYTLINSILEKSKDIEGDCFDAERYDEKYSGIMKKNLNTVNSIPNKQLLYWKEITADQTLASQDFVLYDLRVEVLYQDSTSEWNSLQQSYFKQKEGHFFELIGENLYLPEWKPFSIYDLSSVLPLLAAKQRMTSDTDWMTTDTIIASPDPNCPYKLKITRIAKRVFSHDETTDVPLVSNSEKRI